MRLIFFLLLATPSWAQSNERELLEWNEFYKLQWHDFQGQPTAESIGDAGTYVRIIAKPYLVKKQVRYTVTAYFNKARSWKHDTSDSMLEHERLHFDIAELYARKIRKRIGELSREGVDDVKAYNREIQALLQESNEFDRSYDIETLHGALTEKQARWQKKVAGELEKLSNYQKKKYVLKAG